MIHVDHDSAELALRAAIQRGADRYFEKCRQRIPAFVAHHFNFPGAWHTNKVAFGWDLLKMPFNLLWAPLYVVFQLLALLLGKLGWTHIAAIIRRLPSGFKTQVQAHVQTLVVRNLLHVSDKTGHTHLIHAIQMEIHELLEQQVPGTTGEQLAALNAMVDDIVRDSLQQYAITRTASADITNSIISTTVGAITLKQFTPGGLGFGIIIAAFIAKHTAADNFIFGSTLGGIYYTLFPPEPSVSLIIASSLLVMCILAVVASFSGLITDPVQSVLRLHHYRLNKMITHLHADFQRRSSGGFRPKDQYLARIIELIDAFKTHIP